MSDALIELRKRGAMLLFKWSREDFEEITLSSTDALLEWESMSADGREPWYIRFDAILSLLAGSRAHPGEDALQAAEADRLRANVRSKVYVDMTPDSGMIMRILSAYIDDSMVTDNTLGLPPGNPLCIALNEAQAKRNALLRAALAAPAAPSGKAEAGELMLREVADCPYCDLCQEHFIAVHKRQPVRKGEAGA